MEKGECKKILVFIFFKKNSSISDIRLSYGHAGCPKNVPLEG